LIGKATTGAEVWGFPCIIQKNPQSELGKQCK